MSSSPPNKRIRLVATAKFSTFELSDGDFTENFPPRSFTLSSSSSISARCGVFDNLVSTPALLTPTVGGMLPHLTPDILDHASFAMECVCVPKSQLANVSKNMPRAWDVCRILNHDRKRVFVVVGWKDAGESRPMGEYKMTDEQLKEWMETIRDVLKPNMYVCPGDPVPSHTGSNRNSMAVDRTAGWNDGVVRLGNGMFDAKRFMYVVGRDEKSVMASVRKTQAALSKSGGCYVDVAPKSSFKTVIPLLDEKLVRVAAAGCSGPKECLELIALGYDFIETSYPQYLSKCGYASTFWIDDSLDSSNGSFPTKVDARSQLLFGDQGPLVSGCPCFTCENHMRSYIRHLVEACEMLGETLLYAHNLKRLSMLFAMARVHIAKGTFHEWFAQWKIKFGCE